MKDGDFIEHLFVCSSHDYLLFFTNRGKVYRSKVYELPEASRTAKGRALVNILPLREGERDPGGALDARLHRGEVPRLRHARRDRQEDRVRRLQHADQSRRDHRDQHPRRRRAGRRARASTGTTRSSWSPAPAWPCASPSPTCARWAATPTGVRGMDVGAGRATVHRDGRRPRRHGPARGHRERLRQAHPDQPVPQDQPRRQGRQDDRADRAQGRPRRRARRARAPGARVHPRRRHGPADVRRRHLPAGPLRDRACA